MRSLSFSSSYVFSDTLLDVSGWIYVVRISISMVYCSEFSIIRFRCMSICAVLLDFDGVLVHAMPLLYRIFSDKQGNILLGNEQEYDATLIAFLSYCRAHSILLAIGSNSRYDYIRNALKKMNVQDYFITSKSMSTILGHEDMKMPKSDPEFWRCCADMFWIPYAQCMVIEDSISGIVGAKKWGIKSCYYHRFCFPEKECIAMADYHVDNFDDIIKLLI